MKIEQLQLVKRNESVNVILRVLANSTPKSNTTNLKTFLNYLLKKGNYIKQEEFMGFFSDLVEAKIGYFRDANTFMWHYKLKEVCEQILYPNKVVDIEPVDEISEINISTMKKPEEQIELEEKKMKKRPGRPKGSKNKNTLPESTSPEQVAIQTAARNVEQRIKRGRKALQPAEPTYVLNIANKIIALKKSETEQLLAQLEYIKTLT